MTQQGVKIIATYDAAKTVVTAGNYGNAAMLDKLYTCFPKPVTELAGIKSIASAVMSNGLPSGTLLNVQQISDNWQILRVGRTVSDEGMPNHADVDMRTMHEKREATGSFTATEVQSALKRAQIKYGWDGKVTVTGGSVDIGGLKFSKKGKQILWGQHLTIAFSESSAHNETADITCYEASRTTVKILYRPERGDDRFRVEQGGGGTPKMTALDREWWLSYARVMMSETLGMLTDAGRRDARRATQRSTVAAISDMLLKVGPMLPSKTLEDYIMPIITGFEAIERGVAVNAADKDILLLFWYNFFKKIKVHVEEYKNQTLVGVPTPYLSKLLKGIETGPAATTRL